MASSVGRLSKKEVVTLYSEGKRIHSPHLLLVFKEKKGGRKSSFTVIVSKKINPLAVKRNELKRKIRAVLQSATLHTKIIEGVFVVKSKAHTLSPFALKEEITTLLKKI